MRETYLNRNEINSTPREESTAENVVQLLSEDPAYRGAARNKTNWEALSEGLIKTQTFEGVSPVLITSVGGDTQLPTPASIANIIPGLRLIQILRRSGYDPLFRISFASEFAISCNGVDEELTRESQRVTESLYRSFMERFYPATLESTEFERLSVQNLETDLPSQYVRFAYDAMREPETIGNEFASVQNSLVETGKVKNPNAGSNEIVRYLLSHPLIFRDIQHNPPYEAFVIKIGAPSEIRFSAYQQLLTEAYINSADWSPASFTPQVSIVEEGQGRPKRKYGQISLYYPRVGSRPPYYRESSAEPSVFDAPSATSSWLENLSDSSERYRSLLRFLRWEQINPSDYSQFLTEFKGRN